MHRGTERYYSYLLAFLVPILGLVQSVIDYKKPYAKNIFWIFCMFYGLVHIYYPEGVDLDREGADSVRYAMRLEEMHNNGVGLSNLFDNLYDGGQTTDPYILIVTFMVSIFTTNAHILFFVFAAVFGYFLSRNIWYVIGQIKPGRMNAALAIFVISFALITPIWQINGVRMWTALHIFVYGLLPYLVEGDKSKLKWCFGAFLVHFSFIVPSILLLAFIFMPRNKTLFLAIFLSSFMIQSLDLTFLNHTLTGLAGGAFDAKVSAYANETYMEEQTESAAQFSAHVVLAKNISTYIYQAFIVLIFFLLRRGGKQMRSLSNLFCGAALFYALGNIMSLIPSGSRFILLAQLLTLMLMVQAYQFTNKNYRLLFNIAAALLIFPIIFSIRVGTDYWGISLLLGNPITCWFFDDNVPLIQYIKG